MPASNHPLFKEPDDLDCDLWRYMDLTKFVYLLETRSLYFARSDLLGDAFEGSYSNVNEALRPIVYDGKIPANSFKIVSDAFKRMRPYNFISCGHRNARESAAMWRLYARSSEAIAVRTTFRRLKSVLPQSCYLGEVTYADYGATWIPENNSFQLFLHKRDSFSHENEVRAIICDPPFVRKPDGSPQLDLQAPAVNGKSVKLEIDNFVDEVYVAPDAPNWFRDLVAQVALRYNLNKPVVSSALDERPTF